MQKQSLPHDEENRELILRKNFESNFEIDANIDSISDKKIFWWPFMQK